MTSKAERKRRKKAPRITLPGGAQIEKKRTQGQRNDMEYARRDAQAALTARLRRFGYADGPDNRKAISGPEFGCCVGAAIMADNLDAGAKADLWQAVCHMRRVWATYDRAIGAPSRHAKCLGILAPTGSMETDASAPPPDLRSPEDRDRQAVAAYMTLRGWLGHCDNAAQSAAIRWIVDVPDAPFSGYEAIKRALLCVVDGMKGRKITARFG